MTFEIQDIINCVTIPSLIKDPYVQNGEFIMLPNDEPEFYSGGFTVVFPIFVGSQKWAFRCWQTDIGFDSERFRLLSEGIENLNVKYLDPLIYVNPGIAINGVLCPTTRMKWVYGDDLKTFIWNHRKDRTCLLKLGLDFLTMTQQLHSMSIAHGDLQHANIIVDNNNELHLIDYDSMFVPELASINAKDIIAGKPDYQHPARGKNVFANEKLDYFSEAIILCSILAMAYEPELAEKYSVEGSEGLLFTRADFESFSSSTIYRDLSGLPNCVLLLRDVIERYLAEDDINKLAPIDVTVQQMTSSSASFEQYISESENEYQDILRELEKRREQERIAEQKRQDDLAWAATCRWDAEDSYSAYLRNYPNGIHCIEAKNRIEKLKEERKEADEQYWKRCCLINMSSAYEKYIKDFPYGLHIAEARRRRDEYEDCEDWAEATKTSTERSITSYLANHPSGKFADNAKLWLKRNKEEDEKWKRAQSIGTITAYKSYLSRYPKGKYSKQAKELIKQENSRIRRSICAILAAASIASLVVLSSMYLNGYFDKISPARWEQQFNENTQQIESNGEVITSQKKLDRILKGMELAKKEGEPINQERLHMAENELNKLRGTAWYDRYRNRLDKIKN